MSEINYETTVDDLSKPGNESALESALNEGFNDPAGDEPADVPADQNNNVNPVVPNTDNLDTNLPPAPAKPASVKEPLNDGTPANDDKGTPSDRFKDVLSDRNAAREVAANAQTDNQVLAEQIKNLTEEITKMKTSGGEDPDGSSTDEPVTAKGVEDMVKNILSKSTEDQAAQDAAAKSDANEVANLFSDKDLGEAAKPYESKIKGVMAAHPTMSALAAYALVSGLEALQNVGGVAPISNAKKSVIGNRTKTNLRREVKATDLPAKDQEAYLQKEVSAGRLNV